MMKPIMKDITQI